VGVLVDAKSPTHSSTNEIKASCRIVAIHVSHLSREKHEIPGRAQESAHSGFQGSFACALVPLGWWSLLPAGPDIHLLPQAPKSCRRRLSVRSLPVPKQLKVGLGSCLLRPAGQLQDLAACALNNPVFVLSLLGKFFHATALATRFSAGTKSCCLRSTASI
jgi:hypothetical protein